METLIALGAGKVGAYDNKIPPNLRKVVDHYVAKGFLEILKFQPMPGVMIRSNTIAKMDCFYRNMNKYKFMILIDLDEAGIQNLFLKV